MIDTLWSPASTQFVVNDWSPGPGSALDSYLYNAIDIEHPISIGELMRKYIQDKEQNKALFGEVYITAEAWLDSHTIRIHVETRDHPCIHELEYDWDLQKKFKCIMKR
jgi:hypothetical protein